MSDEEASPEESVGDASEAPEEEAPPRLGLAFTDLTIESMEALSDAPDVKTKLRILCELTDVNHYQDNTWSGVFVDYLYYGLAFAGERSFSDEQTSALFSILKNVFEHAFPVEPDTNSLPLEESHAFFKDQMLTHSVDDAEAGCIQLFTVEDVKSISEFLSKPISARGLYERLIQVLDRPRQFVETQTYRGPDRRRRDRPLSGVRLRGRELTLQRHPDGVRGRV